MNTVCGHVGGGTGGKQEQASKQQDCRCLTIQDNKWSCSDADNIRRVSGQTCPKPVVVVHPRFCLEKTVCSISTAANSGRPGNKQSTLLWLGRWQVGGATEAPVPQAWQRRLLGIATGGRRGGLPPLRGAACRRPARLGLWREQQGRVGWLVGASQVRRLVAEARDSRRRLCRDGALGRASDPDFPRLRGGRD